jgi:glycosyltransferase involved in cell wall biosynthesis
MTQPARPVLGMILKGYPRISETFISNEILLLEQLGFSIHLFSMRHPRESFSHDSIKDIRANVDYLPDTLLTHLPKLLYPNFILAAKQPAIYAKALVATYRRWLRSFKSATLKHLLQAGYLVYHLLPGSGVTHLHAHFAHSPTSVALFASQLSGLKFSFTAHAKDIYTSNPGQLREKLKLAQFAVTCTGYNRQYLSGLAKGLETPVYRVYHGIDIERFSKNTEKKKASIPHNILTVARLTPKKGLLTVLKAIRYLCDKGFSLQYTLIGDGDDRDIILSAIKDLNLSEVVRWLGTQPHEIVVDHYRRADLFVLGCEIAPNGDRDGIPNVLIESMAMGTPVVATSVSAIPELVDDEKTGLLVPPGEPKQLAEAMIRMLTDERLRVRLTMAAKNRVIKEFDNKIHVEELAEVYRKHIRGFGNGKLGSVVS